MTLLCVTRATGNQTMEITFLGATGTVTGSRYLLTTAGRRILVDCGLFQGLKQLRLRNREPFPVEPSTLDAVILTHAHLDHSGYLPLLVREGFSGPVFCTPATEQLCGILLPDSGHLQEEEAAYANRAGYSRHRPAEPLYTEADAIRSLDRLVPVPFEQNTQVVEGVTFTFHPAGHILGAAMISMEIEGERLLFSGDLGRLDDPLLPAPAAVEGADHLVVESTYGDRRHPEIDPADSLAEVIQRTARRGGVVLIPSFAVGRAQHILYLIHRLKAEKRIPDLPVYLDSPMAGRATRFFSEEDDGQRLEAAERRAIRGIARAVDTVAESKAIDRMSYPRVIISASGMATGGRVLHHLKALAPDARNTVLFAGYQAAGTRGAAMLGGAGQVKIHGSYVPIRAEVAMLDNLSAHADADEILTWLAGFQRVPRTTWITHGEPVAADALRHRIEEELGWSARVPDYRETVDLTHTRQEGEAAGISMRQQPLPPPA